MIHHHIQHIISALCSGIEVVVRVIAVGQVDKACQHCGFREVQFIAVLAEIVEGCFLNASDMTAEVQLVHVKLEDLFFADQLFQLDRKVDLLNFVGDAPGNLDTCFIILEVGILDQLHRECGTALGEIPGLQVFKDRFGKAGDIESEVREET